MPKAPPPRERSSVSFFSHPLLYRLGRGGNYYSAEQTPYTHVLHVQNTPNGDHHFPNTATDWLYANTTRFSETGVALYDDGKLHVIDILARDATVEGGYIAAFILFSGGNRATYEKAVRFVRKTKDICLKNYHFHPRFLLLHVTRSGMLRKRWVD